MDLYSGGQMAHHFVYPAANAAQQATAYPTVQTAYVTATPQAAYATAQRAGQAYDTYQTAHAAPQYAYARTQVAVTPAVTYEQKTYYQPAQATYTAAESQYGAGTFVVAAKPAYSSVGTTYAATQRQAVAPKAAQQIQVTTSPATYVYSTATTTPTAVTTYNAANYPTTTTTTSYSAKATPSNTGATSYTIQKSAVQPVVLKGYDAALYSAATSYYQQQQAAKVTTHTGTWNKKPGIISKNGKPKMPPKQPQLHYCDVCKISCAGPQTYREHLEGQKHKKKEAALKVGSASSLGRGSQNQLRCELCDVTCTGSDAYSAHIRGAKHQKVLKLHTKLGKPIPSTEPVVVTTNTNAIAKSSSSGTTGTTSLSVAPKAPAAIKPGTTFTTGLKKVVAPAPKITFVGGTQLKTTGSKVEEIKVKQEPIPSPVPEVTETKMSVEEAAEVLGEHVQPVGQEYIEEVKNELGKIVSFNCKLCECKFNDPNAKEMHMKGRRHRLQYKKKVDPNLQVEIKPSIRVRKIQEEKLRRQAQKEEMWRRKEQEQRWREEMRMEEEMLWAERQRYQEEMEYYEWQRQGGRPGAPPPRPPFGQSTSAQAKKPDSYDDRHVMAKHATIYPNETELQIVQNIVSACEKALKLVSDSLADSEIPKPMEMDAKKDIKKDAKKEVKKEPEVKEGEKKDDSLGPRVLKGVMRVGVLAKGLLLHGDLNVHLVLLCSEKPTRTLLERVADLLSKQLAATEEKYDVKRCVEEAAIIVTNDKEPRTSCTITLASPVMRDISQGGEGEATSSVKDPPDVLDRQKCLDALAALRHAKWFQARATGLQSCVVIIRILRDLCQRVPTWTPLNEWAMELLVEKCLSSGGTMFNPGDALRRVFECIASGMLLPGGPGLLDPCEKDPLDAAGTLTHQEREDITASAQHALRLIAFRQIYKVLGMDPLPAPRFRQQRFNNPRKRRRTDSAADGAAEKKDKKDEDADSK
ncbi:hypothetical protein CHS0354_012458 [Potamilus streckersoni]|uniref:DZF domain-containing protein n=1 Tax=Potamilus streckersoni TaxID=2493646 RepID=A0AAE0VK78_9BIVA|nr:hypothetical protein CHS0354_012458 [Potamilus streckersoni]